ncbi:DUF309 domain-containing protein [Halalkalibacter nanhaiisediminis]|uniref:DUF309 domain-containing protein n=1 Tax=Halalkalibacter nanhaiisediminis TaxID=688079 RepID=A0A562QD75_9BACI|nr:DUF309 domain-containing protein [Halalkalibacter nanhaiisediminis]TWI54659.1 hypothetical protein IQ10_02882 [Halalkalibacter nanhaiisediminis]
MYPKPYLDYLIYFHVERDYFECHEILEEYWKAQPRGKRQVHWVGLIQIAVGLYHQRRGNINGARRMYKKAASIITGQTDSITKLGLDVQALLELLNKQIDTLEQQPFADINLPITDKTLLIACKNRCGELGIEWNMTKSSLDDALINKHTIRDRSDVIAERARQLVLRQTKQGEKN